MNHHSESFTLTVGGQSIKGFYYAPSRSTSKKCVIVFVHGWQSSGLDHNGAQMCADAGFPALTFYMCGHGESSGDIKSVTAPMSLADLHVVYAYAQKRHPKDPIILVGSSYGSYIAALFSASNDVQALSLRVPANYQDEYYYRPKFGRGALSEEDRAWRQKSLAPAENRALKALHDFPGKILIFEAGKDDQVDSQTVKNYAATAKKNNLTYHFMPDWTHSIWQNPVWDKQYHDILLPWILEVENSSQSNKTK